jgi:beta-glucosidase
VKNAGGTDGDEVAQLYVRAVSPRAREPLKKLCGFRRVHIKAGQSKRVSWVLRAGELAHYDEQTGAFRVEPGRLELMVGASSADIRGSTTVEVR